jgi:sugar phosphate isomerase/epimerase
MRIESRHDLGHLSYCTNIHAGESWADVRTSLATHLPAIKAASAPDRPFGIGLRLAARAVDALRDPAALEDFQDFLASGDYYVFTINGFPYGAFHGQTVKENVYAPDWSKPERLAYTNALADLLAGLLPQGQFGSISTVPGTFKPWVDGRSELIADRLLDHVAHLVDLERRTGRTIALALEPEPCCMLETIAETAAFFNEQLFSKRAVGRLAETSGLARGDAEQALRRHVGVCYDVCHAAVEYEDPAASIAALRAAGISIPKLQLSSALRIADVTGRTADDLRPFDEPVYLHQVIERRGDQLHRFADLPEALSRGSASIGSEWRVHFHVPVFLDQLKDFGTTQFFLREILALHAADPISPHLEVETYTWDVLPDDYRNVAISTAIARELDWVAGQLLT